MKSTSGLDKLKLRTEAEARIAGHTPTPWRVGKGGGVVADGITGHDDDSNIDYYGGHLICESIVRPANGAFLVLAVNSYDAMRGALQNLLNAYETGMLDSPADEALANAMDKVRQAIDLARGANPSGNPAGKSPSERAIPPGAPLGDSANKDLGQ